MDLKLSAVLTLQLATIGVLASLETLLSPFPPLATYLSSLSEMFLNNGH